MAFNVFSYTVLNRKNSVSKQNDPKPYKIYDLI